MALELVHGILDIDINRLEEEWVGQSKLFSVWSEKLADARKELSEVEADFELTQAELNLEVRDRPQKYGLKEEGKGPTVDAVKSAIMSLARYKEGVQLLINVRHKVHLLEGFVKSLDSRKTALGKLVDLHGQQYFSVPKASTPQSRERMDEAAKENAYSRIGSKLNKKSR